MDYIINNNNNRHRVTTALLAAAAILLLAPATVSARGADGADREKMDSLLQSLFDMRAARRASDLSATPRLIQERRLPPVDSDLSAIPSQVDTAWLLRARPPLPHEEISSGLLRVSGASAMRNSQGSASAAGGETMRAMARVRALPAIGEVAESGDAPSTFRQYEYVRDLRRKFEKEQQS